MICGAFGRTEHQRVDDPPVKRKLVHFLEPIARCDRVNGNVVAANQDGVEVIGCIEVTRMGGGDDGGRLCCDQVIVSHDPNNVKTLITPKTVNVLIYYYDSMCI